MANEFAYEVQLFVRHPSIPLAEIEQEMSGWPVDKRVNAGAMAVESRGRIRLPETPAPCILWATMLTPLERPHTTVRTLEDFLADVLARLDRHSAYFASVVDRDGYVCLSIACFGDGRCVGTCLPFQLFGELGRLSLSIELSVYGGDDSLDE